MPVTFSLVAVAVALKLAAASPASWARHDAGHVVERRDEAENLPLGLDAFAQREYVRIRRTHGRIDDDAAVNGQTGVLGDLDARPFANRHHQDIRRQHGAIVEFDGFHLLGAVNCFGVGLGDDANAARLDSALKEMARGRIELAFHQGRHQMHDRDVHALFLEARGGL